MILIIYNIILHIYIYISWTMIKGSLNVHGHNISHLLRTHLHI